MTATPTPEPAPPEVNPSIPNLKLVYSSREGFDASQDTVDVNLALSPEQAVLVLSETNITVGIAGIRGGKTHAGALKMILYALTHPCAEDEVHLVCSPTYSMSKVPVEKFFKLLYDKRIFPVCPVIKFVRSERMFILAADGRGKISRIIIRSVHDPDRLRGLKALSCWGDEAAYFTQYAWEVILGRVSDSNGPIWLTTTPSGYNWVYELYEKARQGDPDITIVHWASTANPYANREGLQRLVTRYDARTYQQEVAARFIRGRGLVYYPFARGRHLRKGRVDPSKPLWVGQDFNVDPMASVISQPFTNPDGQEGAHILMSRKQPDSNTYALCVFLDEFTRRHKIAKDKVTVFADAAGNARSTAGKSDFKILRSHGYRVEAPSANPMVKDRINCVNGLLSPLNEQGRPSKHTRLLFDPEAVEIIDSLEKQIWEPNSDPPKPDKSQGFDHCADALGYQCWKLWPLRRGMSLGKAA